MRKVTMADFQELFSHSHPLSISLYLPTDEVGLEATKRKALLQNSERLIWNQLSQLQVPDFLTDQVMGKLAELRAEDAVWEVGQKSLALFVSPDFYQFFQLPITVKELVHVSQRFHLKPLIRLIAEPQEFYILSLSKKSVRLFKGDRYGLVRRMVPNLPQSIEAVIGVETDTRRLQFHTSTDTPRGGHGNRPASFHGQSAPWKDDKQRYLNRFLQAVDKVVADYLENTHKPLLLVGVERMLTTYMEISKYPHLVQELCLKGNAEEDSLSMLHQESLQCLEPYFIAQEKAKVESVLETGNANFFSVNLDDVLRQAHLGRVDTVVVAQGVREWGAFDPNTLEVTYTDAPVPEAHDLLDTACAVTLMNGGKAFVLPPEEMPDNQEVVAVFRYQPPEGTMT